MNDFPLDAQGIRVFEDWLLERGFVHQIVNNRPAGLPYSMKYEGKISTVFVYWFFFDDALQMDVQVEWESAFTRIQIPYSVKHQRAVPITWRNVTEAIQRAVELSERIDASATVPEAGVPKHMDRPPGLSSNGAKAWKILVDFFKKHDLTYTGGCTAFYSPEEWEAREGHPVAAVLIVVYDGGEHRAAMTYEGDERLVEQMQNALGEAGMHFEELTSWSGGVYTA